MSTLTIVAVDYADPHHAAAVVTLLDHYASGSAGGGEPLPEAVRRELPARLAAFPTALGLLAYADDRAVGLANAFLGFSTFTARPLLNLHDLVVDAAWRGRGVGRQLLGRLEVLAREHGCCKLTLEVLADNVAASELYRRSGFVPYRLDPALGVAQFWHKPLDGPSC